MTEYQVIEADETVYRDGTIKLHGPEGFEGMRKAGRLAAEILDELTTFVQPGVTTGAIDDYVRTMMLDAGSVPATMGYRGYEHSCCTSINHVICHGIPSDKALKDGDIVNIDVTPLLDGWHGDTSRMFFAGEPSIKAKRLVEVTYECLMLGIDAASKPGARLGDIGAAIHAARAGTGPEMKPGMFFTIEPMINAGRAHAKVLGDGWTAVTRDKSLSAQFEHSIGITDDGVEIFTESPKGLHKPPY
jgi:methionyl aminopeptidase